MLSTISFNSMANLLVVWQKKRIIINKLSREGHALIIYENILLKLI